MNRNYMFVWCIRGSGRKLKGTKCVVEERSYDSTLAHPSTHQRINPSTHLQHPSEDGAASHSALQILHLTPGLVNVEGADHDESGLGHEVALGDGDLLGDVLAHHVDVELELRRDGNDGCTFRHSAWGGSGVSEPIFCATPLRALEGQQEAGFRFFVIIVFGLCHEFHLL